MKPNKINQPNSETPTLTYIIDLAKKAGEILRSGYAKKHKVDFKGEIDLVTEIDYQTESFLINEIQGKFPDHSILAEESGESTREESHLWSIDPLDGTVNYAHDIPVFCVSIAYAYNGSTVLGVIYEPMRDECFSAESGKGAWLNGIPLQVSGTKELKKSLLVTGFPYDTWNTDKDNTENFINFAKKTQGVRRLGSAALDLAYVAAGRFDGYWELSLSAWDVAAGGLIAKEAGAIVTNIKGGADYISKPQSILACSPGLHSLMLEELEKSSQITRKLFENK